MRTRKVFVQYRNAFYNYMILADRQVEVKAHVAAMASGSLNSGNRAKESQHAAENAKRMHEDYDFLKKISAKEAPNQDDYDQALSICQKWGVRPCA